MGNFHCNRRPGWTPGSASALALDENTARLLFGKSKPKPVGELDRIAQVRGVTGPPSGREQYGYRVVLRQENSQTLQLEDSIAAVWGTTSAGSLAYSHGLGRHAIARRSEELGPVAVEGEEDENAEGHVRFSIQGG
jgi:hypothetical protein